MNSFSNHYGFHPKSCGLMYKIPALETVAGVAVRKFDISKSKRMPGVRAILSLLASVSIYNRHINQSQLNFKLYLPYCRP